MDRIYIVCIGGLLPAFAFGISAVFQKAAIMNGVGPGTYLVYDALVALVIGLVLRQIYGETDWGLSALPLTLSGTVCFTLAGGAISFALWRWQAPISLIAPITVISTLVTVVLSLWIFAEHEVLSAWKVLVGALLVVAGAALVASS